MDADGEAPRSCQRLCGLPSTGEVRAVDGVDGLAAEARGEELGLLHAAVVERRVGRLGGAGHHVGGPAVADEEHLALVGVGCAERGLRDGLGAVELGHAATVAVPSCCAVVVRTVIHSPSTTSAMPAQPAGRMSSCTTTAPSSAAVIGSSRVSVMTVGVGR